MNPRPPGYEPDELPGCSTPRPSKNCIKYSFFLKKVKPLVWCGFKVEMSLFNAKLKGSFVSNIFLTAYQTFRREETLEKNAQRRLKVKKVTLKNCHDGKKFANRIASVVSARQEKNLGPLFSIPDS